MASSPFFNYIQMYFPPDQWVSADCISQHECPPSWAGYPDSCIGLEPSIDCAGRPVSGARHSYGVFQIFESCWNPALNPSSPFTPEQWAQVMDPNINTWMASVIWSRSGWGAWSTSRADLCNNAGVPGGAIPHPKAPCTNLQWHHNECVGCNQSQQILRDSCGNWFAGGTQEDPACGSSCPNNALALLLGLGLLAGGIYAVVRK